MYTKKCMGKTWQCLTGKGWAVCSDLLDETNVLIAGCAGSGKSELIHSILVSAAIRFAPCRGISKGAMLWLADPKRVELSQWKALPHCYRYENTYSGIIGMLDELIELMEDRYEEMEKRGIRKWDKERIYLVIDELGDMMTTNKKVFSAQLTKLMQLSRAAGIHVIAATQSPSKLTIPASAQINYSCSIGLRCKTAVESRQVIGMAGCENLPRYGTAYKSSPDGIEKISVPMTDQCDIDRIIKHWTDQM